MRRLAFVLVVAALICTALASRWPAGAASETGQRAGQTCLDREDAFEDNDDYPMAWPITLPFDQQLHICFEDWDLFSYEAQAGTTLHITVTFERSNGVLDQILWKPDHDVAASTDSTTNVSEVEYYVPVTGTYRTHVFLWQNTNPDGLGNDYHLTITETEGGTPPPTATASATSTPTATPPQKAVGDVNDDGAVDSIDAALVLQYVAGVVGSLPNMASADADGSGSIDAIDAALILQFGAGLIGSLPP